MDILVIIAVVVGLYMAWNIGANDVANSMADAVGSRALTIVAAVVLAGICEFAGAVLVGGHVTDTIRKGIVDPANFAADPRLLAHGMVCAMLAAGIWLNAASYAGMPVSTTHSIVGALIGFGIVEAGFSSICWGTLGQIVASWFISPIVGGLLAYIIFRLISHFVLGREKPAIGARRTAPVCVFFTFFILSLAVIFKGLKNLNLNLTGPRAFFVCATIGIVAALIAWILIRRTGGNYGEKPLEVQLDRVERIFTVLVIFTSCTVAFAHGANDVANAVGPLAAVVEICRTNTIATEIPVSMWILVLGGIGIVVGLTTFGYRVIRLVGTKVTEITPSRGVAADIAAMTTVLACSRLGLPVSTTHTLVGAILGVGLARGITAINAQVVRSIFTSWFATVPIAAILTIVLFLLDKWLFL